jgi:putative hemolysin
MDPHWHVEPTPACRVAGVHEVPVTEAYERLLPTVLRMDFRLGFRAVSPIAWDPEFRSYDILVLADRQRVTEFYESLIDRVNRKLREDKADSPARPG